MKSLWRAAISALVISGLQIVSVPTQTFAATSYLTSGSYYAYETFSASGNWSRPFGVTQIDYLVVAGGGRGGGSQHSTHYAGGGGGGGGVRAGTVSVGQSAYTITVGTGQTTGCSQGRGGNSSLAGSDITTVTSTGGGSGSCNTFTSGGGGGIDANSGGSGGGGGAQVYAMANASGNAGGYSPVEGYAGGTSVADGSDATKQSGGGGGGAGEAGSNGTTACAGRGGNGFLSAITGSNTYYGGGGGGGTRLASCGGTAGNGGGGTGGVNGAQGSAGTDGFGGGGGGTSLANGNKGGSGVVIIRFLLSNPATPDLPAGSDSGSSNSDNVTSSTSFSLTGTAVGGSSVQIYDGASAVGSPCTANASTGAYSCSLTSQSSGSHTYTAKASFGGGAEITSSGSLTVVVDATAPTLTPAASVSFGENQTTITTVSCNESCALVMNAGADSASVTFTSGTGLLVFNSAPDYELPTDVGGNRTYEIGIQATDTAGNVTSRTYVITITNTNESSQVSTPAVSGEVSKGVTKTVTVSVTVAGKVRFFVGGKRITGCLARTTSGSYPNFTATCSWKPAVSGRQFLTATITPTDNTFSGSTSARGEVFVLKRAGAR
jgi:hypothetical protein